MYLIAEFVNGNKKAFLKIDFSKKLPVNTWMEDQVSTFLDALIVHSFGVKRSFVVRELELSTQDAQEAASLLGGFLVGLKM